MISGKIASAPAPVAQSQRRLGRSVRGLVEDRLFPHFKILIQRGLLPEEFEPVARALSEKLNLDVANNEAGVIDAFSASSIRTLVLKGALLARTVYGGRGLRLRTDLDLLIAPSDRPAASSALSGAGLVPAHGVAGDVLLAEQAWVEPATFSFWSVDLHWQLLMHPAFARVFSFEELWSESTSLEGVAEPVRGLCYKHAFLHACLHYYSGGQHRGKKAPLVWVLDMDLLWRAMKHDEQLATERVATERGFASLMAAALRLSEANFLTPVEPEVLQRLDAAGSREWRSWLLRPFRSRLHDTLFELRSEPGVTAKLRRLHSMCFPAAGYMRAKFPEGSPLGLPGLYARRFFRGIQRYWPEPGRG